MTRYVGGSSGNTAVVFRSIQGFVVCTVTGPDRKKGRVSEREKKENE